MIGIEGEGLERAKGFESIRDHRPVCAKLAVFMHVSMGNTRNAFWPARSENTSLRSQFVIRSDTIAALFGFPFCCFAYDPDAALSR